MRSAPWMAVLRPFSLSRAPSAHPTAFHCFSFAQARASQSSTSYNLPDPAKSTSRAQSRPTQATHVHSGPPVVMTIPNATRTPRATRSPSSSSAVSRISGSRPVALRARLVPAQAGRPAASRAISGVRVPGLSWGGLHYGDGRWVLCLGHRLSVSTNGVLSDSDCVLKVSYSGNYSTCLARMGVFNL